MQRLKAAGRWLQNRIVRLRIRYRIPALVLLSSYIIAIFIGVAIFSLDSSSLAEGFDLLVLKFPPISSSIYESFVASWWEDVVFFGLLGLPALLFFSRDPINHNLNARISWLFSGHAQTKATFDYVKERVHRLSAIVSQSTIHINIISYDANLDSYRVSVRFESTLCNILKNEDYTTELRVSVYADKVDPSDHVRGAITQWSIHHPDIGPQGRHQSIIDGSHVVLKSGEPLKKTKQAKVTIPRNSSIEYLYSFWQWSKIGVDFSLTMLRFTEKLDVRIWSSCGTGNDSLLIPYSVHFPANDGEWQAEIKTRHLEYEKQQKLGLFEDIAPGLPIAIRLERPIQPTVGSSDT